ncbi:hypothetical protein [Sinomonas sp. ASV322]|uniref:hypothetical protein n=1 Tax=Sinomonas sp. ASV322 TaxID=3041920 RepID=UPI0027DE12BF|nr:hypothetical protein [Sinomonas sp. ASV322]MDQ4502945.1 hypothetical protein [Sinomonas sp. ASV322]
MQTLTDGSIRALTVLNNRHAPVRYDYRLELTADTTPIQTGDGSISLRDRNGTSKGWIAPAWAVDANGAPVKTHYEVNGNVIAQIVEHTGQHVAYPVIADPRVYYAWWQLFNWSEWHWNSAYGMNQLSIELSIWGRHDLVFNAGQFLTSGWNLLKEKHSWWMFTDSMRQQWECHVLGGIAEPGTFDLEYERRSVPDWRSRIGRVWPPQDTCNW